MLPTFVIASNFALDHRRDLHKLPLLSGLHKISQDFLGTHECSPRQHLDRFSRFCAAHPRVQLTGTLTTPHATYVGMSRIGTLTLKMRMPAQSCSAYTVLTRMILPEAVLPQTDRATRCVSRNSVNCRN